MSGVKTDLTPARIPPAPAPMTMTFIGLYSSTENSPKRGVPASTGFASLEGADIGMVAGAWERRGCNVKTPEPIFISSRHGDAWAHVSNSTACLGRVEIDAFFAWPRGSEPSMGVVKARCVCLDCSCLNHGVALTRTRLEVMRLTSNCHLAHPQARGESIVASFRSIEPTRVRYYTLVAFWQGGFRLG